MSNTLIDFKVQFKCREIHPIKSEDLAEMVRIGLAVMQSDPLSSKRIILSTGAVKIKTDGRGWNVWQPRSSNTKVNQDA